MKIIIAACLSAIILCTSIFVTLNLSKIDAPDNLNIDNISTLISGNDSDYDNSSFSDDSTESDVSSIIDDASSENSSEDITVDSTDETTNVENESTEEPSSEDISDDVTVPDEPSNDSSSDDSSSNHIDADEKIPDSFNELGFKYAETNAMLETNTAVQSLWAPFEKEQHKKRWIFGKEIE